MSTSAVSQLFSSYFIRLSLAAVCFGKALLVAAAPPNIVVFISDDHTLRDSSVYGSGDIVTPHMDRLAAAGMTFDRAFAASPTCAPSRAAMLTGLMPARNGAEPNQSEPRKDIKKLPAYLQELGYEVVAFGKVGHYNQTLHYGFDHAEHTGYHEDISIPAALEWLRNRHSHKPLALFVGSNWPHVPWPITAEGHDPQSLAIPENHVETPATRRFRGKYYAAISRMDAELGQVWQAAQDKFGTNLFFLHFADQGAQWPFGKWCLYDDGLRTPMIAVWPGHIAPGSRTPAMVSLVDVLPTLVEVAGGNAPAGLDGQSFAKVLSGETNRFHDRVFFTHSGDGSMNVYPSRAVRDDRWKYILNLHPEYKFTTHITEVAGEDGNYWQSWVQKAPHDADAATKVHRYQERPHEELYDLQNDPFEKLNLAGDPGVSVTQKSMHDQLVAWMKAQGDQEKVWGKPTLLRAGEQRGSKRTADQGKENSDHYGAQARQVMDHVQKTFWDPAKSIYTKTAQDRTPDYVWRQAAAFSALVGAARHEPQTYRPILARFFRALDVYWDDKVPIPAYEPSPTRGNGHDKYYDDNAWLVITFLEAYDLTGDRAYFNRARETARFVLSGWDEKLDGGIWWHQLHKDDSKNTCANGPAAVGFLYLARLGPPGEAAPWLGAARKTVAWTNTRLQASDGLFDDRVIVTTGEVKRGKLTYNSALMLRADLGLYRQTGRSEYLDQAKRIGQAAEWFLDKQTGVYRDPLKWSHFMVEADLDFYRATGDEQFLRRARANADAYYAAWSKEPPPDMMSNVATARILWLLADMETPAGRAFWAAAEKPVSRPP